MRRYRVFKGFAFLGFAALAVFGFGMLVMLLWNSLMPVLFGLPVITFVQALGLLLLSRLLFGGFPGGHRGKHHSDRQHSWKARMREKWSGMTPEERAEFKQKMQKWRRHGCYPADEGTEKPEEKGNQDLV